MRKTKTIIACLALSGAAALGACGGSGGSSSAYPVNIQTNFLNACDGNGGDQDVCTCALSWLEGHISLTTFEADEDQLANGGSPTNFVKAATTCRS